MRTPIKISRSTVSGNAPTTSDITSGELSVNLADKRLFSSNGTAIFDAVQNVSSFAVQSTLSSGAGYFTANTTAVKIGTVFLNSNNTQNQANLGLVIGTNVQAYSANLAAWAALATASKQDASANLTSWAGLTTASKQNQSANLDAWSAIATSSKVDSSVALANSIDLNTVITSGFYRLNASPVNGPATNAQYSQLIVSRGSDTITQMITIYSTAETWVRSAAGIGGGAPIFTAWTKLQPNSANLDAWSAIATSTKQAALGYTPVNKASDTGVGYIEGAQLSMNMGASGGLGNFVCRASGTGDANYAGMTFWNDYYAVKLGVRNDGVFSLGGWSRAAHSWYSTAGGDMVAAGNVIAYSDPRLKKNFKKIGSAISIIQKLDGGSFIWKKNIPHTECKAGKRDYGVLADQVQAVLPEIVYDSIDIKGVKYKMVAYEKLIPVLIEAIKELKDEFEDLKKK